MGKGLGAQRMGRHIDYGRDTPVANLLLAMLDRVVTSRSLKLVD